MARIVEEIAAHDPDVIALTEYRARPGVALCAELRDRGWPHLETTNPTENVNGIAVFSRTPMRRTGPCPAPSENQVRWLDIDLPEYGFGVGVLHIMAAGSNKLAKARFWDTVLSAAEARLHEPFLFVGDWNTGAHRVDEKGKCRTPRSSGTEISDAAVWDRGYRLVGHRQTKVIVRAVKPEVR